MGFRAAKRQYLEGISFSAPKEMLVEFPDNRHLIDLCGPHDENLKFIEEGLGIQIVRRGNRLILLGEQPQQLVGSRALRNLYRQLELGRGIQRGDIDAAVRFGEPRQGGSTGDYSGVSHADSSLEIRTKRRVVEPRTPTQGTFVRCLRSNELVFGIGPAGTGKTYLAVAQAVSMLAHGQVDKIVLSRPAVEAGERIGFLPGDMKEKVDPYMQPLYDALNDFTYYKQLTRYLERGTVEILPLAFMRGRTLNSSFIVLDEAQNTTRAQMKMFLTRLGQGSRMAITGDLTQIDLPKGVDSGLFEAIRRLRGIRGVGLTEFISDDVVRHPLVARIVEAYANSRPSSADS